MQPEAREPPVSRPAQGGPLKVPAERQSKPPSSDDRAPTASKGLQGPTRCQGQRPPTSAPQDAVLNKKQIVYTKIREKKPNKTFIFSQMTTLMLFTKYFKNVSVSPSC